MTDDRDPGLQRLFAASKQELADDTFTTRVFEQIDVQKRRTAFGWVLFGVILIPCSLLLVSSTQDVVLLLTRGLTTSLFDVNQDWLALLLSPVNSVAGVLAIGLKVAGMAYRRLFS